MKLRYGTRGAALVEYAILTSLIGIVAIGSVSNLGKEVVGGFEDTAESLAAAEVAGGGGADEGGEPDRVIQTPTISWNGSETDALPFYVTDTGSRWVIDLEPLLRAHIDPDDPEQLSRLRFNASVLQTGTFEPKFEGANSVALHVDPRVRWIVPWGLGTSYLINKSVYAEHPESEAYAYEEIEDRDFPDEATGITIQRFFSCTPNARCERGEFAFNIDFFLEPE